MIKISASTNPPKEDELVGYVKQLQKAKVDMLHCDVMRSNFVDNECLSLELLKEVKQHTLLPLDVHLMINEPLSDVKQFAKLGVHNITIHYEAFEWKDVFESAVKVIRKNHAFVGLAVNPKTPIKEIIPLLSMVDIVLIMGVYPGKSGQKMLSNTPKKIEELKQFIRTNNINIQIQVDGGVNMENIKELYNAGADIVVMGNALYTAPSKSKLVSDVHKIKY